nr:MAG TPA: hypothetical protein [Caudoviricetes sp.]
MFNKVPAPLKTRMDTRSSLVIHKVIHRISAIFAKC